MTITVQSVDDANCQVTLSMVWGGGLEGEARGVSGRVDGAGNGSLQGSFTWVDGSYNISVSVSQLAASGIDGSYTISARPGGPTQAAASGTFDT